MRYQVRLRKAAETEIAEAAVFYEERRPGLGEGFVHQVERGLAELAERPEAWPQWHPKRPYRKLLLDRFPFALFYRVDGDTVTVIAVAHAKRRPGYFLGRERP
ncbi:MAG: type II toxin-antitoxin system RelE/ParE family toxin [Polyangiaceae bacterium]